MEEESVYREMPHTVPYTPPLLTGFMQRELVMAQQQIEDAVVYLQLRNVISAAESLRRAMLLMNLMERYLQSTKGNAKAFSYQISIDRTRERIETLRERLTN